jgi:hypothetical protein
MLQRSGRISRVISFVVLISRSSRRAGRNRTSGCIDEKARPRLRRVIDRRPSLTLAFAAEHPRVVRPESYGRPKDDQGRNAMEALIVGLASIAVIWLVVIYGSVYMNKNVQ